MKHYESPKKRKTSGVLRFHIAQQIMLKRKRANLTQEELSKLIGYRSKQVIDNWERQASTPSLGALYLLSMAFNSPIEDFILSVEEFAKLAKIRLEEVTVNRIVLIDETSDPPMSPKVRTTDG